VGIVGYEVVNEWVEYVSADGLCVMMLGVEATGDYAPRYNNFTAIYFSPVPFPLPLPVILPRYSIIEA